MNREGGRVNKGVREGDLDWVVMERKGKGIEE